MLLRTRIEDEKSFDLKDSETQNAVSALKIEP